MISVFSSYITRKDMDLVLSRMVEDAVVDDVFSDRFEKAIKEQFQFEYAIALRSPYYALLKALKVCELGAGARIAISALAPSWHRVAVEDIGLTPIILDIEEETLHPSSESIQRADPSAIILFDALGKLPSSALLDTLSVPVIEDISQTLGNSGQSRVNMPFAYFSVWGLEADSPIATGGGALLCARGKRDAQILRALDEALPPELKMTDYNAALGLSQLKSYSQMIGRRKTIREILQAQLARTRHSGLRIEDTELWPGYAFPVFAEASAKEIIDYAKKHGVQAELAFASSSAMLEENAEAISPSARSIALRCVLFPMHHKLSNQQVDQMGKIIATLP
ncbi:MAG: DegT/DnrJ/EryC1/StrS family aminotransferase [Rectinema sp.]